MINDLKRIEIEIHSFCNRQCLWCPNKYLDRNFYEELPEETFIKILKELKEEGFDSKDKKNVIWFSRFNDPMYNIDLLSKRLDQTKEYLPNVKTCVNTNGDFLSKEGLSKLKNLDHLNIMDYDCIGLEAAKKKFKDCGIVILRVNKGHILVGTHKYINKIFYRIDWPKHAVIEDRGGILRNEIIYHDNIKLYFKNNDFERVVSCSEPIISFYVYHTGEVTPCTHIRPDYEEHKQYIVGNVKDNTIFEIYNSAKMNEIKERLSVNNGQYLDACKTCQKYLHSSIYSEDYLI